MRAPWLATSLLLASALLALALATPGEAHAEAYVSPDWPLTPDGLEVGDSFRLLFVTQEPTSLERLRSLDSLDYFVMDAANAGHSAIWPYSGEFKVLASCGTTDARDHTSTTFTDDDPGVPIYWLTDPRAREDLFGDGSQPGSSGGYNKVADDYRDFYDGSWDSAEVQNQHGHPMLRATLWEPTTVWTGSNRDGTASYATVCQTPAIVGSPDVSGKELEYFVKDRRTYHHVYGLSDVLMVSNLPGAPRAPIVSSVTNDSATIDWYPPASSGATPIFDYNVEIRTVGGSWTGSTPSHWGTDTTLALTGLSPDTEYEVRVLAKNHGADPSGSEVEYGPASPATAFRTHTVTPSAPSILTVFPGGTTATVSWDAPVWKGSPPLHDYDVQFRTAPDGSWLNVKVSGTGGITFTLENLTPDTRYEVRVHANNSSGPGPWSPVADFYTYVIISLEPT